MSKPKRPHPPLEESPRFRPPMRRRDFLGLAAIWSTSIAFAGALVGAMRLPMPAVFPESNPKVKLGPPAQFPLGAQPTLISALNIWVYHDAKGLYAISAVCTHLGCIINRDRETGIFHCPCHGSVFDAQGAVMQGPAPKPLNYLALEMAPDGQLVVDQWNYVAASDRLVV